MTPSFNIGLRQRILAFIAERPAFEPWDLRIKFNLTADQARNILKEMIELSQVVKVRHGKYAKAKKLAAIDPADALHGAVAP